VTIRNFPDETYHALRARATQNGRSMATEVRAILEEVLRPTEPLRIGSELAALGRQFGGIELDIPPRS